MLEIHFFGQFEVCLNNRNIWLRSEKIRIILKLLAMDRGEEWPEERLIEVLWPECGFERKRPALRRFIHELRRTLEPGLKHGSSSKYIVNIRKAYVFPRDAPCWIDLEAFEKFKQEADKASRLGELQQAISHYEKAIELYRGDFLKGDLDIEESIDIIDINALRENWRNEFLEVVRSFADLCFQLQRENPELIQKAIKALQKAKHYKRDSEELYRKLAEAYYLQGDKASAFTILKECQDYLSTLNLALSERTAELLKKLSE